MLLTGCAGQAMRQEMADRKAAINASADQCSAEMSSATALDPIRQTVQVFRRVTDGPPPFEIASNDTFPTEAERPVISVWATMLEHCSERSLAIATVPPSATPQQAVVFQQDVAFSRDALARVSELTIALYQQKLTYGEFAQRRYAIVSDATAAELAFQQSIIDRDAARQRQAQQQFATTLAAWGTYMEGVNARQPQTVYVNGTIRVQ